MNLDLGAYRVLAKAGIALMILTCAYLVYIAHWQDAMVGGIFLLLAIAFIHMENALPSLVTLFFVLAALANASGWVTKLGGRFFWYDDAMHAFTGAAAGLVAAFYIHYSVSRGPQRSRPGARFVLLAAGAALIIGIGWEIFELAFGLIGPPFDTLTDLVADTLGGLLAGAFSAWAIRHCPPRQLR